MFSEQWVNNGTSNSHSMKRFSNWICLLNGLHTLRHFGFSYLNSFHFILAGADFSSNFEALCVCVCLLVCATRASYEHTHRNITYNIYTVHTVSVNRLASNGPTRSNQTAFYLQARHIMISNIDIFIDQILILCDDFHLEGKRPPKSRSVIVQCHWKWCICP